MGRFPRAGILWEQGNKVGGLNWSFQLPKNSGIFPKISLLSTVILSTEFLSFFVPIPDSPGIFSGTVRDGVFWGGSRDLDLPRGHLQPGPAVTTPGLLGPPKSFWDFSTSCPKFQTQVPSLSPFLAGFPSFGNISQILSAPPSTRIC